MPKASSSLLPGRLASRGHPMVKKKRPSSHSWESYPTKTCRRMRKLCPPFRCARIHGSQGKRWMKDMDKHGFVLDLTVPIRPALVCRNFSNLQEDHTKNCAWPDGHSEKTRVQPMCWSVHVLIIIITGLCLTVVPHTNTERGASQLYSRCCFT